MAARVAGDAEDALATQLYHQYTNGVYYTQLQEAVLVAVNAYGSPVDVNGDAVLRTYKRAYRDLNGAGASLPPHIYGLACNAYFYMRCTAQDQSFFFLGEPASGKSETRRLAVRAATALGAALPGRKGARLVSIIPAAQYVLDTFTRSHTADSPQGTCAILYTELQYGARARLVGFKTLEYYLQTSLVTARRGSSRTFSIFYLLAAGASPEERKRWRLERSQQRLLCVGDLLPMADPVDATRFARLREALQATGIPSTDISALFDVLAAIIQLAGLDFCASENGSRVLNEEPLYVAAALLGSGASSLAASLTMRTRQVRGHTATMVLDVAGAEANRDALCAMLYSLVFTWLNEELNRRFSRDDFSTYIGFLDVPGWQNAASNSLDAFCINMAAEFAHQHRVRTLCVRRSEELSHEGLSHLSPPLPQNLPDCLRLITHVPGGLVHIMDDQTCRRPRKNDNTMTDAFQKRWVNHAGLRVTSGIYDTRRTFVVTHFFGSVSYDATGWLERNDASLVPEHVALLRGTPDTPGGSFGSSSTFVRALFSSTSVRARLEHAGQTVVGPPSAHPARAQSMRRRPGSIRASTSRARDDDEVYAEGAPPAQDGSTCVAGSLRDSLKTLFDVLDDTKPWFVNCLRPNDSSLPNMCDPRTLHRQVHALGLGELRPPAQEYVVTLTYPEFCERYGGLPELESLGMRDAPSSEAKMKVSDACALMNWSDTYLAMGLYKLFLSQVVFRELEDRLRSLDDAEQQYCARQEAVDAEEEAAGSTDPYAPWIDSGVQPQSAAQHYGEPDAVPEDAPLLTEALHDAFTPTHIRAAFTTDGEYDPAETKSVLTAKEDDALILTRDGELEPSVGSGTGAQVAEELHTSRIRRFWVALTWALTFWLPSPVLRINRNLRRSDVRMAWREKLAINMIIWFICICSIFVIVFLGNVVCPKEHLFSRGELSARTGTDGYTSIRGEVFALGKLVDAHLAAVPVVPRRLITRYAGQDATPLFPVQVNALCNGIGGSISPWVTMDDGNTTDANAQYHDFRAYKVNDVRPDWYYEQMWYMRNRFRVGFIGYTSDDIDDAKDDGRAIAVYNGYVYDLTQYVAQGNRGGVRVPQGMAPPPDIDRSFIAPEIVSLFTQNPGADISSRFDALPLAAEVLDRQRVCLRNLFLVAKVDHRNSPRCTFSKYILLAISLMMVATIGFKFVAALQFIRPSTGEEFDKFVICQVPCYTEGAESIRKTINSLARMRYDDKRKLIFVICDGNLVGAGNDAPTPEIVLDVLGHDPDDMPEPRSFVSLGEGSRQHNMARVYSGLYEHAGHIVPYLVVAKCGKPTEQSRPGNRGKRDSQLVLMRFFNKVYFGHPMSPLELDMYHHMKNIIGVNPSFYEYVLQVDADTEVDSRALSHMVAAFVRDKKVIGLCGETAVANQRQSATTMLQVYEYYISHYMVKAFESLFGSITCLPGCFSMYRIRTQDTNRPLVVSHAVLDEYAENRVDTLHTKNLLHLGEDRFLTTLMLKHFPEYKTTFVRHASCKTIAPESWNVLLSQRRRWINSTVHNLVELLRTPQLCGFCLFSMRFIVMIDLLSTIIAPVSIGYIVYLIILVAFEGGTIPITSVILLAAIYGLQMIIFLLNRRFDMIGWMFLYILGLPLWSLILPLYSFWRMDDFSWGNTRVVMDEHGQKLLVHHEGTFDPAEIPHMTWEEYENQLWRRGEGGPHTEPASLRRAPSLYGHATAPIPEYSAPSVVQPGTQFDGYTYSGVPSMFDSQYMSVGGEPPAAAAERQSWRPQDMRGSQVIFDSVQLPDMDKNESVESMLETERWPSTGLPPDAIIRRDVRRFVAECDLTTVTKRQIRAQLEALYGCSIDDKKAYINSQIEAALLDM
ncbi:chitin synthase [Malassezia cuniculi]|uniref:chitin synthase n=1 Tax=Malassezia cuniculi TaxID=948313 RepID=A0AAF0EWL2_9BASI|nr:chitin synthase [Malassezia cuniculi]